MEHLGDDLAYAHAGMSNRAAELFQLCSLEPSSFPHSKATLGADDTASNSPPNIDTDLSQRRTACNLSRSRRRFILARHTYHPRSCPIHVNHIASALVVSRLPATRGDCLGMCV